jgi:N-acyl-D-amino-acid deacylase
MTRLPYLARAALPAAALAWLAACSEEPAGPANEAAIEADILITGGLVFDGAGADPVEADIAILGERIVFVGNAGDAHVIAADTIHADGRWVTPGFIDAHSHAELDRDYGRDARPYLHQGITTVVLGLDGGGEPEVAERLALWDENGTGVNGMLFVGHGAIRRRVMGLEDREPTPGELDEMRRLVRQGMDGGAFGLSTGLFYVPGTYASTEEVIELAKVAAGYPGAIYDTHDRDLGAVYEGVGYDASVAEAIRIGEEAGIPVIFSHYNLQGAHNYGRGDVAARYVNEARGRGVDVWAAHHPYDATQSNLRSYTIPNWAAAGSREAMLARFDDPEVSSEIAENTNAMLGIRGGADRILFADPRPELNGKTLADVAAERELSPALAAPDILREGNAVVMNLELYDDDNTRRLAREPWMMTCTDGRTPRPDQAITHPRTFGAFPKKMRMMVLDEPLLEPAFVVRSFSGLAADFYALEDRGYLREGYYADVVILDPARYRDTATYEEPRSYAEGVDYLLVNGRTAIADGQATGVLAGHPLTRL